MNAAMRFLIMRKDFIVGIRNLFYRVKIKLTQNIKYDEAIKTINRKILFLEENHSNGHLLKDSEHYLLRREKYGNITKIAIASGGGLGDYIIILPILDSVIACGECTIDFYTENNFTFPEKFYSNRSNISIQSCKFSNLSFEDYDFVLYIDHYITRGHCSSYRHISTYMPSLSRAMIHIEHFNSIHRCDSERQPWRNVITLKQAKFSGLNRWTYLSPGNDIFEMKEQRAGIPIIGERYGKYKKNKLSSQKCIVLNRGADPVSGGSNQTKVWPKKRYEEFIALFKKMHPSILAVQVAANKEAALKGADDVIRDADLDDLKIILKHAIAFVGSEGGIAHLASQMSTPCAVVFGPTPEYYYGYARNKNIVSPYCSDCMGAIENWYTQCLRGHERAECMKAVTGEMVLNAVEEILSEQRVAFFEKVGTVPAISEMLTDEAIVGFIGKDFVEESMAASKNCAKSVIVAPDYLEEGDAEDLNRMMSHNRTMRRLKENGVTPLIANCFNIPKDNEYFDILVADSCVQSDPHAEYAMKELLRALKIGGTLLLCSNGKTVTALRKVQPTSPPAR